MVSDPMTLKRNAIALIHFIHVCHVHYTLRAGHLSFLILKLEYTCSYNVNHVVGISMKAAQHWMHVEETCQ